MIDALVLASALLAAPVDPVVDTVVAMERGDLQKMMGVYRNLAAR